MIHSTQGFFSCVQTMSFRKVDFHQPKKSSLKDDLYSTSPYTATNKFELPIKPLEEPALAPTQTVEESLPASASPQQQQQQQAQTSGSPNTVIAPDPQRSDGQGVPSDGSSLSFQTNDITNSHNELFLQGKKSHNLQVPKISETKSAADLRTNSLEGYGSDVEEGAEEEAEDEQWDNHPLTQVETVKLEDIANDDKINVDDIFSEKSNQVCGDKLEQVNDKNNEKKNENVKYNAPNSAMNAFFNTNASAVPIQSTDNTSKKAALFHNLKHQGLLPTFQKRPLSDTPVHSLMNSPNTNNTPNLSPLPSNLEMSDIDERTNDLITNRQTNASANDNNNYYNHNTYNHDNNKNNKFFGNGHKNNESTHYTDTDYTSSGMDDSEADSFYANNNTDNFNYTTGENATDASNYSTYKDLNDSSSSPNIMNNGYSPDNNIRNASDRNSARRQRKSVARKHLKKPPLKKRASSVMTTLDVPGLTKSKISPDGHIAQQDAGAKLVIVMVGLPATGKSFLTNKLSRFLNFSMYECRVFNVGNTRREYASKHKDVVPEQDSKFFDPKNENSNHLREQWAMDTLDQLLDYLLDMHGNVAIFDATNTTKLRRNNVVNRIRDRSKHLKIVFLESICSDEELVAKNIKLKLLGPDYKGKNSQQSLEDFENRLKQYRKAYQPVEDEEVEKHNVSYVKMIDVGKKVISYNIQGYLASQTIYYLLNFNLSDRQIWITRNGESEYNVSGKIGGDSKLTTRGLKYSKALAQFIRKKRKEFNYEMRLKNLNVLKDMERRESNLQKELQEIEEGKRSALSPESQDHHQTHHHHSQSHNKSTSHLHHHHNHNHHHHNHHRDTDPSPDQQEENVEMSDGVPPSRPAHEFHLPNFFVWTSMLKRSIETAQFFDEDEFPIKEMKMLNELSAGDFEGLTYQEIQQEYPEEFEERLHDKLLYRYPGIGGESYFDVINRLRTVITELERITDNVLLICHRVVARVLLGYFLNLSKEIYSNLDVPLHSVYCLETTPYGVTWKLFEYDEALNDFHEIPQDEINTKVVQQVGIVHQERRFSVVPTLGRKETDLKKLLDSNSSKEKLTHLGESSSERTNLWKNSSRPAVLSTNPFTSARNVPRSSIMNSQNSNKSVLLRRNDSGNNTIKPQEQQKEHIPNKDDETVMNSPKDLTVPFSSAENIHSTRKQIMDTLETHQLEIEKLSEKLQKLKQNDKSDDDS